MKPDDELCLCFHVTRRKVENYLRVQRPVVASQLSECFGAGTGCGWCRPYLRKLWERSVANDPEHVELPDAERYSADRKVYRQAQRKDQGA